MHSAVTPLAGVWIEISSAHRSPVDHLVTPLAGVWIEIVLVCPACGRKLSHPSRVCGLKSVCFDCSYFNLFVTPLAGVWIEINPIAI